MRKLVVLLAALVPLIAGASQRVIVFEDFTATWCTYCPGAARGIDELDFRAFDSVVSIAYHSSNSGDPYYNAAAATRASYYGLQGYPTVRMDGKYDSVVGGVHTGTMYPTYRQMYDARKSASSPLEIEATCTYDSTTRTGHLEAVLRNTSGASVSGQLQCVVVENHIYYPWQGMDSLQYVERMMLPDASGEAVTIPAGDSLVKTRDFALTTGVVAANSEIVVFVQNNSTKQMIQGGRTGVIMKPRLVYAGYQHAFPAPGLDANLTIGLSNLGTGTGQGVTATLTTSDPYVTVTSGSAGFSDIGIGTTQFSNTPFQIHVDAGCPNPHLATMNLQVAAGNGYAATLSFPLNVTANPGAFDSMEAGINGWTHNGILDGWHQTTHRSTSPSHSWYCGVEGSWQYGNENDARLMTPYFTVNDGGQLSFRHFHSSELNYDYCLVELGNGGLGWQQLASYTGTGSAFELANFDLSSWAGQTVQIRFRFISDNSVTAEGWYIDDFWCSPVTGVAEQKPAGIVRLEPVAGVVTGPVKFGYQIPPGRRGSLLVFDAQGRRVAALGDNLSGTGSLVWALTGSDCRPVGAGSYFIRLVAGSAGQTARLQVAH
jgi:thiol-disulfide isomerase/thioredoxin